MIVFETSMFKVILKFCLISYWVGQIAETYKRNLERHRAVVTLRVSVRWNE